MDNLINNIDQLAKIQQPHSTTVPVWLGVPVDDLFPFFVEILIIDNATAHRLDVHVVFFTQRADITLIGQLDVRQQRATCWTHWIEHIGFAL
jgi:hypothetical protein